MLCDIRQDGMRNTYEILDLSVDEKTILKFILGT
jgi:hypothetical protein